MKKGITPIIAIIVLLLITIALAGAAWTFISQYMGGVVNKNVQMSDAYCQTGLSAVVVLKSIGTENFNIGASGTSDCDGLVTGAAVGNVSAAGETSGVCGDLTVIRTDGGDLANAYLNTDGAITPGGTFTFRDDGCTSVGSSKSCSYRFLLGGIGPVLATVTCSG